MERNLGATVDIALRFIELSDETLIQKYAADPRIAATSNVPHPYPEGAAKEFVRKAIEDREIGARYAFAILRDGDLAGVMTLNGVDGESASLDYWVAAPFWNQGVATAAASMAVKYAFQTLKLRKLHSQCLVRNIASSRVLEKAGFRESSTSACDANHPKFAGELLRIFVKESME